MSEEYHTTRVSPGHCGSKPRYGSASLRRQIRAVKVGVRIERVASEYGGFEPHGTNRLLGRCVSPSHEDKTPSLTIFTDTQTFKCFGIGCGAQGDLLNLVMLAEGCELWVAMVGLSTRYGITLPGRPANWYAKQERQRPIRERLEEIRVRSVQRRLFRLFETYLSRMEGLDARREEADAIFAELHLVARLIVARMKDAGA